MCEKSDPELSLPAAAICLASACGGVLGSMGWREARVYTNLIGPGR